MVATVLRPRVPEAEGKRACRLSQIARVAWSIAATVASDAKKSHRMRLHFGVIVVDSRGSAPGAARLHLADGLPLLRPEEQVFEAMLDGWRNQQLARNLALSTIEKRAGRLRAFFAHAGTYPWEWAPQHAARAAGTGSRSTAASRTCRTLRRCRPGRPPRWRRPPPGPA